MSLNNRKSVRGSRIPVLSEPNQITRVTRSQSANARLFQNSNQSNLLNFQLNTSENNPGDQSNSIILEGSFQSTLSYFE